MLVLYIEGMPGVHRYNASEEGIRTTAMKPVVAAHNLAVVVPFRNCFDELVQFVPYMSMFLNMQKIPHHFYVINQADILR